MSLKTFEKLGVEPKVMMTYLGHLGLELESDANKSKKRMALPMEEEKVERVKIIGEDGEYLPKQEAAESSGDGVYVEVKKKVKKKEYEGLFDIDLTELDYFKENFKMKAFEFEKSYFDHFDLKNLQKKYISEKYHKIKFLSKNKEDKKELIKEIKEVCNRIKQMLLQDPIYFELAKNSIEFEDEINIIFTSDSFIKLLIDNLQKITFWNQLHFIIDLMKLKLDYRINSNIQIKKKFSDYDFSEFSEIELKVAIKILFNISKKKYLRKVKRKRFISGLPILRDISEECYKVEIKTQNVFKILRKILELEHVTQNFMFVLEFLGNDIISEKVKSFLVLMKD